MTMPKNQKSSWLPKKGSGWVKREATTGRYIVTEGLSVRKSASPRGTVTGAISLPNGDSIPTVRKDVMDRALGRGEFKKS